MKIYPTILLILKAKINIGKSVENFIFIITPFTTNNKIKSKTDKKIVLILLFLCEKFIDFCATKLDKKIMLYPTYKNPEKMYFTFKFWLKEKNLEEFIEKKLEIATTRIEMIIIGIKIMFTFVIISIPFKTIKNEKNMLKIVIIGKFMFEKISVPIEFSPANKTTKKIKRPTKMKESKNFDVLLNKILLISFILLFCVIFVNFMRFFIEK